MEYKIVLCLLLSVIAAYADDKEEKVEAAVSLKDNFTPFLFGQDEDFCYQKRVRQIFFIV